MADSISYHTAMNAALELLGPCVTIPASRMPVAERYKVERLPDGSVHIYNSGWILTCPGSAAVTPPPAGPKTVTLSWSVPTVREDGSPLLLTEISRYEIYYFVEGDPVSDAVINIDEPSATEHSVEGLSSGTYHFSIATFDESGQSSAISETVSATIEE